MANSMCSKASIIHSSINNGKFVEVTGTVSSVTKPAPGVPLVLHVTGLKKLADFCQ